MVGLGPTGVAVGTGIQNSLSAVRLVSPFALPLVPEQGRWLGQLVRGYLAHSAVPANIYQRPFRVTAPGSLRRRAENSGFLGFAAQAAAPVRALGPVKRPARWHYRCHHVLRGLRHRAVASKDIVPADTAVGHRALLLLVGHHGGGG
jgi:hypothetical protein